MCDRSRLTVPLSVSTTWDLGVPAVLLTMQADPDSFMCTAVPGCNAFSGVAL